VQYIYIKVIFIYSPTRIAHLFGYDHPVGSIKRGSCGSQTSYVSLNYTLHYVV